MGRYVSHFGVNTNHMYQTGSGFANVYDLVHMLARAIHQASSTDRLAVRDALEHLPAYDGLVKDYVRPFAKARHDALTLQDYKLGRFQKNGDVVTVTAVSK